MDAFLWIYALCCLMVHQVASSVQNVSVPNRERVSRRNSKMPKMSTNPGDPMKNFHRINKVWRKNPAHGSMSNEVDEISDEMQPKIINGRDALEGEFPFVVALHHKGRFRCGAFLISENIVMTAAHCVKNEDGVKPAGEFHGAIGSIKRACSETRIEFSEVVPHPEYGKGVEYDIAFLRTTQPVELSEGIQTICLPASGRNLDGETVTAVGWGRTSESVPGEPPQNLMTTELTVMPQSPCSFVVHLFAAVNVTDRHVCANSQTATGVCFGDSGGPLVYRDPESNKTMSIGVTSFGIVGCGRPNIPSVYTATASYAQWIKENAGENAGICFV